MPNEPAHDPRLGFQRSDRDLDLPVSQFRLSESEMLAGEKRRVSDGGIAALVLGAVVTLLAPLFVLISALMAVHGPQGLRMGSADVTLATVALVVCCGVVLLLGVAGLFFAVFGMAAARRGQQPLALPLAGLFLNAVALLLFFCATIDMVFVLTMFNRVTR
jgi:hypothetical protein